MPPAAAAPCAADVAASACSARGAPKRYVAEVQCFVHSEPQHGLSPAAAQTRGVPMRYMEVLGDRTEPHTLPFVWAICKLSPTRDVGFRIDASCPRMAEMATCLARHLPGRVSLARVVEAVNTSRVAELHRAEVEDIVRGARSLPPPGFGGDGLIALDLSDRAFDETDGAAPAVEAAARVCAARFMPERAWPALRIDPSRCHPSDAGVTGDDAAAAIREQRYNYFVHTHVVTGMAAS